MTKTFTEKFQVATEKNKKLIAASIQYYRITNLINNKTIVKRSGLGYSTILTYENGTTTTPMIDTTIGKIAKAIGVTIEDVMNNANNMEEFVKEPSKFKKLIKDVRKNFSDNLIYYRTSNDYSRIDIAEKLGIAQTNIYYWEKGKTIPNEDIFEGLSKIFNITRKELVSKNENITSKEIEKSISKSKRPKHDAIGYGINLKYYRLLKGYSLSELARIAGGTTYASISKYEHGIIKKNQPPIEVSPNMQNMERISKALGVRVSDIMDVKPSKERQEYVNNDEIRNKTKRRAMAINLRYYLYQKNINLDKFQQNLSNDGYDLTSNQLNGLLQKSYSPTNKVYKIVRSIISNQDDKFFLDEQSLKEKVNELEKNTKLGLVRI